MSQDGVKSSGTEKNESQPNQSSDLSSVPSLPEEAQAEQEHAPRRRAKGLLLDDNEGDFRAFLVHPGGPAFLLEGQPELPKGVLIPLPQYPGFMNASEAQRHIQLRMSQHNATLSGQVVAVVKFCKILKLEVVQQVKVNIMAKPKREPPLRGATGLDQPPSAE